MIAALFSRTVTDVFAAAFALPNFFRRLLGEGSLSVSFIPVFVDQLYGDTDENIRKKKAQRLANAVFTLVLGISGVVTALCFVFMEDIIRVWLGEKEFMSVPGKFTMAVALSRVTIFYLFLVTSYAFFMAVSQALKRFFVPAVAPALFNLFFIFTVYMPDSIFGIPERKLAWAVIVGGVVQTAMVAIQLMKMGYLPRISFQIRVPGVGTILRNMAPGILGLGASQLMNIMNQKFAAGLEEGAMTYVYYANRLLELPQSLIAISIGTALLPTLSQLLSENKKAEMLKTSAQQVQMMLFLSLPSAVGLYILAEPIVSFLFERGKWNPSDTEVVASLIQIFSLMVIFSGLTRVLIPSFYAVKNTLLPAILTTVTVAFHIVLAPYLMKDFGVQGLILSVTLSGFLNLIMTAGFYRFLVGSLHLRETFLATIKFTPGLAALAAISLLGVQHLHLLVIIALSIPVYIGLGSWMRVQQATQFVNVVRRRFGGKAK